MTITKADAADLLTVAAGVDQRRIGETDAIAWAGLLHDLDRADCIEAIHAHYRESTDWVKPAHIRKLVDHARQARAELAHRDNMRGEIEAPRDPESSHAGYLAAIEAVSSAMGRTEYDRGAFDAEHLARTVRCPFCHARPGAPCVNAALANAPRGKSHPTRADLAAGQVG